MIRFEIPGRPVPYSRPAYVGGRVLTPAKERTYRNKVALIARIARGGAARYEAERLRVDIAAYVDRQPDLDNVAKSINDALNKVLWRDDRQVDNLTVVRVHTTDKAQMKAKVTVSVIGDDCPAPPRAE